VNRRNTTRRLTAPRNHALSRALFEHLEPRAMFAGMGSESWSPSVLPTAPLGTGALDPSGIILPYLGPAPGSSGASSLPALPAASGGSPGGGGLCLPSPSGYGAGSTASGIGGGVNISGPALLAHYTSGSLAGQATPTAALGAGGLPFVAYDPSQIGATGARTQPGSTGSTISFLADAQSRATIVPLVYQPGSGDKPVFDSGVWRGDEEGVQFVQLADKQTGAAQSQQSTPTGTEPAGDSRDDDPVWGDVNRLIDRKTGQLMWEDRAGGASTKEAVKQWGPGIVGVLKDIGIIVVTEGGTQVAGFWWFVTKGDDAARIVIRQPLGKGSTADLSKGTTLARNLREQLAIQEVLSKPEVGTQLRFPLGDPRWPSSGGWVKMERFVESGGREGKVLVHYVWNTITGEIDDLKIVLPGTR